MGRVEFIYTKPEAFPTEEDFIRINKKYKELNPKTEEIKTNLLATIFKILMK